MVAEFRRRRDYLVPALNEIPGIRCIEPGGAFYAFPNVSELPIGADELADRLLDEAGVALLAGSSFGQHGVEHLRISYASSLANLEDAVEPHSRASPRRCRGLIWVRGRPQIRVCGGEMSGFVDVHSHVVPSGDDGARTIEEGLELCRIALEAGTEILFATPHAHAPWDTFPTDVRARRALRRIARADARRGGGVGARPSARLGGLSERGRGVGAGHARTRGDACRLVEFPGAWLEIDDAIGVVAERRNGRCRRRARPVLAHPERCRAVAADPVVRAPARGGWVPCSVSTHRPSSAGTGQRPSAPHGRCSTRGWSRSPRPTPTRSHARPPLDAAYERGRNDTRVHDAAQTPVRRERAAMDLASGT